jgi:hypothetical protein
MQTNAVLASLMAVAVLAFSGLTLTSPLISLAREVRLVAKAQPARRPVLRAHVK